MGLNRWQPMTIYDLKYVPRKRCLWLLQVWFTEIHLPSQWKFKFYTILYLSWSGPTNTAATVSTTTTSTTWVPTKSRSTTSLHTPHQSLLTDLLVDKHKIKAQMFSRLFVCNHLSLKFVPFYKWPAYIHSQIKITDTESSISISFTEEGDFWNL